MLIQIRAPDLPADHRQQGQHQQHDRGEAGGVGERLQAPVVPEHHQDTDEQQHADRHPDQLVAGVVLASSFRSSSARSIR